MASRLVAALCLVIILSGLPRGFGQDDEDEPEESSDHVEPDSEYQILVLRADQLPKEEEGMGSLYAENSVTDLLNLCKDLNEETDMIRVHEYNATLCRVNKTCIKPCTDKRITRLRDAQKRVRNLIENMKSPYRITWSLAVFLTVLFLGAYLIYVRQFNWKTLPLIGHEFEEDPTDGYRYGHYMWMRWVILDSDHPTYYKGMTSDTYEIEYIPQSQSAEEDDATVVYPPWSVDDIRSMTPDPDERLEIYFRRIQFQYKVDNKVTENIKKFKGDATAAK